MRIAILIVNWNGFDVTKACLASLAKYCKGTDIFLLENGSGQEHLLRSILDDRSELFVSPENLGFSGGNNILMREAIKRGYDFVFLLNNDTEVTEGFMEEPLKLMKDEKVGFVNSKLILKSSGKIDTAGHLHLNSGDVIPAGRNHPASEFSCNREILSGCAAALLLRVKMLEEIGLFRDDFFLGYEDVDLTYRASVMGWKGIYCASSIVNHALNASIQKIRNQRYYVTSRRNSLLAYFFNTPAMTLFLNLPWFIAKFIAIAIFVLLTGLWELGSIHFKALKESYRLRRRICKTRKEIADRRKISWYKIWRNQSNFIPAYMRMDKSFINQLTALK